jgi:hypothetical protein
VAENTNTGLPEGVLPEGVIPEALPEGVLPEGVIPETTSAAAPPPAEPPAQPQTDEEYAALMDPMAGTPLSVAAFNAQRGIQHEEVAQAMRYGEALGLDPESLMGDPKALAAAKEEVDFRESIKTLQGAPKLAALLAHNTALAAAAREDLPALNTIEAGVMDVAHGYYARKRMGGDKDAGIRLHDIDRMLSRYDKEEHGLIADVVRMLPTAGAFGAAGVVGAVSVGPVAAPGGALAGPFIYMYQTQAGELYARIADAERAHVERDPSYTPLSQKQMEQAAKNGALTGATIFTLLGNAFNKSLPLANGALQRLGVNIVAEATEDTAVKAALRRLVETGTHGLSGTMAMTAQAISDDATVQKATTATSTSARRRRRASMRSSGCSSRRCSSGPWSPGGHTSSRARAHPGCAVRHRAHRPDGEDGQDVEDGRSRSGSSRADPRLHRRRQRHRDDLHRARGAQESGRRPGGGGRGGRACRFGGAGDAGLRPDADGEVPHADRSGLPRCGSRALEDRPRRRVARGGARDQADAI